MLTKPVTRPVVRSVCRNITGSSFRWAYRFDGVDDYGVLANRAINVDQTIDIESAVIGVPTTGLISLVNQTNAASDVAREFDLRWENGKLRMVVGGAGVIAVSDNVNYQDGLWRVVYSSSTVIVYLNGSIVFTNTNRPRGAVRELSAPTRLAARGNGGTISNYFKGLLYNLKINGTYWPIDDRNQAVQQSIPAGNQLTLVNTTSAGWEEISV